MNTKKITLFFALAAIGALGILPQPLLAAERTVELNVPLCVCSDSADAITYITSNIKGVIKTETNIVSNRVTVTFDDAVTSVEKIKKELLMEGYHTLGEPKFLN